MKLSKFNVFDSDTIFNTRTGALIKPKQEDIATEVTSVVMAQVSCCRGVGH